MISGPPGKLSVPALMFADAITTFRGPMSRPPPVMVPPLKVKTPVAFLVHADAEPATRQY